MFFCLGFFFGIKLPKMEYLKEKLADHITEHRKQFTTNQLASTFVIHMLYVSVKSIFSN